MGRSVLPFVLQGQLNHTPQAKWGCDGCVSSVTRIHGLGGDDEPSFLIHTDDPNPPAGAIPVDFRALFSAGTRRLCRLLASSDSDRIFRVCTSDTMVGTDEEVVLVPYPSVLDAVITLDGPFDPYTR